MAVALAPDEKRLAQIAFTDKINDVPPRLVARRGTNLLPTAESLKGKSVGVEQGSTQETYARTYWEPKGVTVRAYQTQDLVYQDLLSGRLDASLQSSVQADLGFLKTAKGAGFEFAGPPLHDPKTLGVGSAIGVRKDDDALRQQINQALASLIRDGTLSAHREEELLVRHLRLMARPAQAPANHDHRTRGRPSAFRAGRQWPRFLSSCRRPCSSPAMSSGPACSRGRTPHRHD